MPEGDTVFRTARRLDEVLHGHVLTRSDVRVPAFATADLSGSIVEEVIARGKHLLIRTPEVSIHSHLKMEGAWHVYRRGSAWQRPAFQARIVLETAEWQAIGFELGLLELLPRATDLDAVSYLGPDLLGPDWDAHEARRRLAADPDRPIGLALLDQRVLAGLGNVFRAELCFLRGLLPERPVGASGDLDAIIALAYKLIHANRDRSERTTTGDLRPGRRTFVYGREKRPCLRCRTPIRRGSLGDDELQMRVTYFCPRCQT